jgi:Fic family protein
MTHTPKIKPHAPKRLPIKLTADKKLNRALHLAKRALETYNLALSHANARDLKTFELQEALATSFLNGTKTTLKALQRNPNQFPAVSNMLNTFAFAKQTLRRVPFSTRSLCQLHHFMTHQTAPAHSTLSGFRTGQNWIGPQGCSREEAYYLPPPPHKVAAAMRQWVAYSKERTAEPLLQLSQLVAQFLIIHPFMDGNGRIARLIVPLFLARQKLLRTPSLFLSPFIQTHRLAYLRALYAITADGDWREWTLFFLKGIRMAALAHSRHLAKTT